MSRPGEIAKQERTRGVRSCLFLVITATLLALIVPAAAQATLPEVTLNASNPASPGASLTPRIQGQLNEGETKAIHFGLGPGAASDPIAMGLEAENTVRLYVKPDCSGTVAGEDALEKLEGEGIQVAVVAESSTTFYAKQINSESETSPCSALGFTYRQVSSAPAAPTLESVNPPSAANDNFPQLIGSSDQEATVLIYASTDCSGAAVASGTGATFASSGIQVTVADNSETSFSAKASIAGFSSLCSPGSIIYREVTPPGGGTPTGGGGTTAPPSGSPPPAPRLHTVPGGVANDNTPLLTGSAPGATSVKIFSRPDCGGAAVAKGPASTFASAGFEVQVPDNVTAAFSAISVSGNGQSACSDPVLYVEDSTPPHTRITMGPASKTAKRKVVFRFTDTTGDAPGTTFLCKVGKARWKGCTSPFSVRHLRPQRYLVQVKAVDEAGNVEVKPAKRPFKVIRHP